MIRLDISTIIFLYILISAIIILVIWWLFGYKGMKRNPQRDTDYIWICSVCLHNYIDSKLKDISICPVCGSYNKKEEVGA